MDKFAKSILNYFAAFTETRFNFSKKIDYIWTDDIFSAELAVYPEFQKKVLSGIKSGAKLKISIKKNDYAIEIDSSVFKDRLFNSIETTYNLVYLNNIINSSKDSVENIKALLQNAFRKYNLELRDAISNILLNIQREKIEELKNLYNLEILPNSTFNPNLIEQDIFNNLLEISRVSKNAAEFIESVTVYLNKTEFRIIMFDMFAAMRSFISVIGLGSVYMFFHVIENVDTLTKYPLFLIELKLDDKQDEIILESVRDIIIINVPAINTFGFDKILTTPRACRFIDANHYLSSVDNFLQINYNSFENFIFEYNFKTLSYANKPDIKFRLGLQIIQKENRKLLDYSELITHIDAGKGDKFIDFVKNYVSGNVYNTSDEVDVLYNNYYPSDSVRKIISEIPLNLNKPQKQIITALDIEKNKIIVVDGPPGTGKSYTICAIAYWANQKNKSIVITSHKEAALDVIERMLTDKFKQLHPQSKPSILRLNDADKGMNSIQNTLSNSFISGASNRFNLYNSAAVNNDIESSKEKLSSQYHDFTSKASLYNEYLKKLFAFEQIAEKLKSQNLLKDDLFDITNFEKIDWEKIEYNINLFSDFRNESVKIDDVIALFEHKKIIKQIFDDFKDIQELHFDLNIIENIIPIDNNDLDKFSVLIKNINDYLKPDSLAFSENGNYKYKLSKKIYLLNPEYKNSFLKQLENLNSLKYSNILSNILTLNNKEKNKLKLSDLNSGLNILKEIIIYFGKTKLINSVKEKLNFNSYSTFEFHSLLLKYEKIYDKIDINSLKEALRIYHTFKVLIDRLDDKGDNLTTFKLLFENESGKDIMNFIDLIIYLEKNKIDFSFNRKYFSEYYNDIYKKTENNNDKRIKNLNNFSGDIERIKLSIQKGKRLKDEELKVLLDNISCIISEPDIISKYFPMKEDSIDILVIDEASQVSIAESISLILRAKQVVIFGDELQYGAVSAVNVNEKYSKEYFSQIIKDYSEDFNKYIARDKIEELSDIASKEIYEDDIVNEPIYIPQDGTIEWLKTFSIRTSTLNFAKAIKNYSTSLDVHFRSFPEIIDYSNEFFYKQNQIPLIINRIRTKPIKEVLRFLKVDTKGNSGRNINIDEIEAIKDDILNIMNNGFKGTIGIITSFREQANKMEELLKKELPDYYKLIRNNKLSIWFVGDVQGEERDIVYYSFVQDDKFNNADLGTIYPVVNRTADTIRSLKMQRLNVGFSRAKDTMVFVHSMPVEEYHKTRLGDALKFYKNLSETTIDNYIEDECIFGSPAEKDLYTSIIQTEFYKNNLNNIKIIAQFPIGKYISEQYNRYIPKYRVDFLLTFSGNGKEKSLILEYDGVEYHTKNPEIVNEHNFSHEYLEYDIERQIELESYGYKFLRLNKFMLKPKSDTESKIDVLNKLILKSFNN